MGDVAWVREWIRDVPDFPRAGVLFKDLTPLFGHGPAFAKVVDDLATAFGDEAPAKVVGIEARGFIVGAAVAHRLGAGFVPVRKAGKLPWRTIGVDYDLEYGSDRVEMHVDAVLPAGAAEGREGGVTLHVEQERVVVIDDVLATGGTAAATVELLRRSGAHVVGVGVVAELAFLGGRRRLPDVPVVALVTYDTAS